MIKRREFITGLGAAGRGVGAAAGPDTAGRQVAGLLESIQDI
jgi:hypothetical protein